MIDKYVELRFIIRVNFILTHSNSYKLIENHTRLERANLFIKRHTTPRRQQHPSISQPESAPPSKLIVTNRNALYRPISPHHNPLKLIETPHLYPSIPISTHLVRGEQGNALPKAPPLLRAGVWGGI